MMVLTTDTIARLYITDECRQAFKKYNTITFPSHYVSGNLLYVRDYDELYKVPGEVHKKYVKFSIL